MTPIFDPAYIEARDRLIPLAHNYAVALMMPAPKFDTQWDGGYSRLFADKMQRLSMERGLTCGMPNQQEVFG